MSRIESLSVGMRSGQPGAGAATKNVVRCGRRLAHPAYGVITMPISVIMMPN